MSHDVNMLKGLPRIGRSTSEEESGTTRSGRDRKTRSAATWRERPRLPRTDSSVRVPGSRRNSRSEGIGGIGQLSIKEIFTPTRPNKRRNRKPPQQRSRSIHTARINTGPVRKGRHSAPNPRPLPGERPASRSFGGLGRAKDAIRRCAIWQEGKERQDPPGRPLFRLAANRPTNPSNRHPSGLEIRPGRHPIALP